MITLNTLFEVSPTGFTKKQAALGIKRAGPGETIKVERNWANSLTPEELKEPIDPKKKIQRNGAMLYHNQMEMGYHGKPTFKRLAKHIFHAGGGPIDKYALRSKHFYSALRKMGFGRMESLKMAAKGKDRLQ